MSAWRGIRAFTTRNSIAGWTWRSCLAENLGHLPILGGNQVELLTAYDELMTRLVADIDAAKHHVHLLFYIFADDAATAPVLSALKRAVDRGVICRVLFDYVGSAKLRKTLIPRLEGMGVQVHAMLPASLLRFRQGRYDLRNHRKIAVIDGRIGYTGSQNMIRATFKPGLTYQELMVRVAGPIVLELQYVFATDWYQETLEVLDDAVLFPEPEVAGPVAAQTLPSGPAFVTENNQRVIVALIHGARKRRRADHALFHSRRAAVAGDADGRPARRRGPSGRLAGRRSASGEPGAAILLRRAARSRGAKSISTATPSCTPST